ncbi:MAG: DUF1048 domain-containing protein [Anaeroplasmataceae bacterium]
MLTKKAWKEHKKRVNKLSKNYKIVYKEIQKYVFYTSSKRINYGFDLLKEVLSIFEEGIVNNNRVVDITGKDVAAFIDELSLNELHYV